MHTQRQVNFIAIASLIAGILVGALIGGAIALDQRNGEIDRAWDNVTIVVDGTLVANPAYYADHPEALANGSAIRIVDNRRAAIEAVWKK